MFDSDEVSGSFDLSDTQTKIIIRKENRSYD
jgi:hypothetical protein